MPRNIVIGQTVTSEKVRRAKELRSEQTEAEDVLWQALRGNRLDGVHFRRQQIIRGLIVDLYCNKAGWVIEVDGPVHQKLAEQDAERDNVLRAVGLRVIRFSGQQVSEDLPSVLQIIRTALAGSEEGRI